MGIWKSHHIKFCFSHRGGKSTTNQKTDWRPSLYFKMLCPEILHAYSLGREMWLLDAAPHSWDYILSMDLGLSRQMVVAPGTPVIIICYNSTSKLCQKLNSTHTCLHLGQVASVLRAFKMVPFSSKHCKWYRRCVWMKTAWRVESDGAAQNTANENISSWTSWCSIQDLTLCLFRFDRWLQHSHADLHMHTHSSTCIILTWSCRFPHACSPTDTKRPTSWHLYTFYFMSSY